MKKPVIAVLGAGSWGSAMAIHIAASGHKVMLWGRNPQQVHAMQQTHCNDRYLPNLPFPESLTVTNDLQLCLQQADHIIVAVPSHGFMDLIQQMHKPLIGISWLTKGLDPHTHQLLSQLVAKRWGEDTAICVISGPSFAREVAEGLPTALVLASNNPTYQQTIHSLLHHQLMRVYDAQDLIGVQWCGAVKNVISIACGISDGMHYGANAKAALITRGLSEMTRMGVHLGGRQETFMGLAGVGDLVLTCTDDQSRNRRFGLLLGQGESPAHAEQHIGQVVEGKHNAAQVCALAAAARIDMPICQQVNALLLGKINANQAVKNLMQRPAKEE